MKKVIRFKLSGLWNREYPLVVSRIIDIAFRYDPETLHLGKKFGRLESCREPLAQIEAKERSNRYSALMSEYDQKRDIYVNVIYAVAKEFRRTSLPIVGEAANQLLEMFAKHGKNIARDNYTAETKRLFDIIADIERSPELREALDKLSLTPVFEGLKTANIRFDETFMERNRLFADKTDIRAIRTACDAAVYGFFDAVDYCTGEYPEQDYSGLIKELNQLNTYYKQQLKARQSRRLAGKDVSKEEPILPEGVE